jgi:hypothetical protein
MLLAAHDLLDRDRGGGGGWVSRPFDEGFHKALSSECDPEFRDFAEKKIKTGLGSVFRGRSVLMTLPGSMTPDGLDKASWLPKEGHTWQEAGAAWALMRSQSRLRLTLRTPKYDREHGLSDDEDEDETPKTTSRRLTTGAGRSLSCGVF